MSKQKPAFDYSKWDNIELSDDEDDVHPNIERESWFRMKHRARVEREEKEEEDKVKVKKEMATTQLRIKEIEQLLKKISKDDDSDDELEDVEGLEAELKELKQLNASKQKKLDDYDKNKKWNIDNMCHVVDERTIVNKSSDVKFSNKGYALPDEPESGNKDSLDKDIPKLKLDSSSNESKDSSSKAVKSGNDNKKATTEKPSPASTTKSSKSSNSTKKEATVSPIPIDEKDVILSYPQFVEKHADTLEKWMTIRDFDKCQEFLRIHGNILLQENASNYLLLASLEDEMNGYRDKMRLTARQSQILSNIAELAKSLKRHPGSVIIPFFNRMKQREFLEGFLEGTEAFIQKIIQRAIVKRKEYEAEERAKEPEEVDLSSVPLEERLGPGGLDPVEVFESLPQSMQKAFESRDVEDLKKALMGMEASEAEYHMKRCVGAGLWNEG